MNIFYDPSEFQVLEFYHYPTCVTGRIVEWDEGFHEGAPGLNEDVKDLFDALIDDLETLIRIVLANEDEEFSLKALNKIKVEKCLFKIYEQGISENISVRAVALIKNQKMLCFFIL